MDPKSVVRLDVYRHVSGTYGHYAALKACRRHSAWRHQPDRVSGVIRAIMGGCEDDIVMAEGEEAHYDAMRRVLVRCGIPKACLRRAYRLCLWVIDVRDVVASVSKTPGMSSSVYMSWLQSMCERARRDILRGLQEVNA